MVQHVSIIGDLSTTFAAKKKKRQLQLNLSPLSYILIKDIYTAKLSLYSVYSQLKAISLTKVQYEFDLSYMYFVSIYIHWQEGLLWQIYKLCIALQFPI